MNAELDTLRRLQAHERDVAGMQARLAAMPARRDEIAATVDAAEQHVRRLQATLDDLQAKRRKGDSDVAALQVRLSKYRNQLMSVKTTREYDAMLHEIATVDGEIKALEDQVIGWLMDIDDTVPQVAAAQAALEQSRREAEQALAALATEEQQARLQLAAFQGHVETERASLSAATLALYDRAAKRYPLHAVAELKGESCTACNVRLRPMVVSDVRRGDRLVQCDSCTRILFVVPPPPPGPPAPPGSPTPAAP
jgi:uncharacterized protein